LSDLGLEHENHEGDLLAGQPIEDRGTDRVRQIGDDARGGGCEPLLARSLEEVSWQHGNPGITESVCLPVSDELAVLLADDELFDGRNFSETLEQNLGDSAFAWANLKKGFDATFARKLECCGDDAILHGLVSQEVLAERSAFPSGWHLLRSLGSRPRST
jgi:hypothetical protein